jgi:hypothetical protein
MMKMEKILALGIILLFIGVAVAPSINLSVVKASNDNDLVEVTTQACGIKGYGDTAVKLTREQYQNLEQYLVDFRARLNQTSIREDAIPIFKDAVVELDKYGLLPKGMSVESAQRLIVDRVINERLMKFVENVYKKNQKNIDYGFNVYCLIFGEGTNTHFIGIPLIPIKLFSMITLGYTTHSWFIYYVKDYDTYGELFSVGLLGRKSASGYIQGDIFDIKIPRIDAWYHYHVGVVGFTGISLGVLDYHFYFGSAVFSWASYNDHP